MTIVQSGEQPPSGLDRRDARATLGLTVLVLLQAYEVALRGRAYFESDIQLFWHSRVAAFVRVVRSGSWPLWNPWVAFGQPMLADPNTQALYPPAWLCLVLDPVTFHSLFTILHLIASAIGVYALGRRLGLSATAAFAGAAVWVASGPLLSMIYVWNHFVGACWLPWVVLAADRAVSRPGTSRALAWGGATALQLVAGSPDMVVYTQLVVALIIFRRRRERDRKEVPPKRFAAVVAGAAVFAVLLSAAQWLPSLDLLSRSMRSGLTAEQRQFWSIHPLLVLQCFLPVFPHELPLRPSVADWLYRSRTPFLDSLYLGLPTVWLAAASLIGRRSRDRGALIVVTVAGILLALGSHTPIQDLVARYVPLFAILRYPAKAAILTAFGSALLAAMGVEQWKQPPAAHARRAWRWLAAGMAASSVACAGLAWIAGPGAESSAPSYLYRPASAAGFREILAGTSLRLAIAAAATAVLAALTLWRERGHAPRWAVGLVVALIGGELIAAHRSINPTVPRGDLTERPVTARLVLGEQPSRVYAYDYYDMGRGQRYLGRSEPFVVARLPEGMSKKEAVLIGQRMYLYAPTAGIWGIDGSYDMDFAGTYTRSFDQFVRLPRVCEGTPLCLRLLRMGGVSHVVALHDEGFEGLEKVAAIQGPFPEEIRVFRVPHPFPRTYVVGTSRVADDRESLASLISEAFSPEHEILLEEGEPRTAPPRFEGASRIVQSRPDRVVLEAVLSDPGYVVLLDAYDPGWRAHVDGRPAPTLRANVAFQAVPVPAGKHRVELLYRPVSFLRGAAISALALIVAVVVQASRGRPTKRA